MLNLEKRRLNNTHLQISEQLLHTANWASTAPEGKAHTNEFKLQGKSFPLIRIMKNFIFLRAVQQQERSFQNVVESSALEILKQKLDDHLLCLIPAVDGGLSGSPSDYHIYLKMEKVTILSDRSQNLTWSMPTGHTSCKIWRAVV